VKLDLVIGDEFRITRRLHGDSARIIPFADGRPGGRLYEPTPIDRGPWASRRCGTVYTHRGEDVVWIDGVMKIASRRIEFVTIEGIVSP
jgi:hypothetical protein